MATAYSINGTLLPTQPYLATTLVVCGTQIPAGTPFALLFLSPDAATQALISLTTPVTLTFTLMGGAVLRGTMQLLATNYGVTWLVRVMTLTAMTVTTMRVTTDFF